MSSSDQQQLYNAMAESGIGRRFHAQSLSTMGDVGDAFLERVKSGEIIDYVNSGGGYSFYGTKSYEFSVLVCRALLLADCNVQVMSLAGINRVIDDWGYAQKMTDADVLLITDFCSDVSKSSPLSVSHRLQVEDLLNDRWDNSYPVFIQSDEHIETYSDWWSRKILKRVATFNELVEIKK